MYTDHRTGPTLDKIRSTAGSAPPNSSTLRCPWCGHVGVLVSRGTDLTNGEMQSEHMRFAGVRHCPNPQCHGLIFVVVDHHGTVLDSFPPERIDIDRSNIPAEVLDRLEEAIACHAVGAHRAAGALLRSTVEAMCDDREAEGPDLRARVERLAGTTALRDEYVGALAALHLLGPDSVHGITKELDGADDATIRDAIDVVKTVLNVVYQHEEVIRILARHQR
ncbi:MAG: DUF4145 domain-containing protein [Ilumatobacter sp.]|nr:MAG: DUF4145 domain-containing protein [Ilumatobacter sp.]